MATRRAPTLVDAGTNGGADPGTINADVLEGMAEQDDGEQLDTILSNVRDDSPKPPRATVFRVDPETGAKKFLATVDAAVMSQEWVAKRYGGGKYNIRIVAARPNGSFGYAGQAAYDIDPSVKPESDAPAPLELPAATTGDALSNTVLVNMIAQMNAQTQLTVGMVKQLSEGNGTRGPSMLEILSSPAVIALATLLLQNRKDPTDLALKIAEVMKPAAAPPAAASGTDVLSALEKGIALATRLGNRGGGGDGAGESIMPVVAEGIKGIAAVVGAIAQERANASGTGAAPIPQRIAAPAPPPAVLEHEGSHVAPPNDRPWLAVVRPSLGFLLDAARFMSPSSAADTIGRNLTDEQFTDLRDDIADVTPPGFLGRLAQEFPPIANVPAPWLAELVAELEAVELTDEPEPDAATPPAA